MRLNGQSREADADGQLRRNWLLDIHMAKRRNARRYFAPENLNEGRGTGIVLGDCPALLGERARAIVANLQARRLEVLLTNAIGNGSRVTRQYHGCMRSSFGRFGCGDVGVRLTRFQQARIRNP